MDAMEEFDEAWGADADGPEPPSCPAWLLEDSGRPVVVPAEVGDELTFAARDELGALGAGEV